MVKAKSINKGQIQFTCSNGVTAILMTQFKTIKVFYQDKHIDTIPSEDLKVSEFCEKLEGYSEAIISQFPHRDNPKASHYGKE